MIAWQMNSDFRGGETERFFGSIDAVFALEGDLITKDPLSCVLRVVIEGKRYYVKRYISNGKNAARRWYGLRGLVGPQRVKKEWQNLLAFQKWGIPTPTLVCYGLERRFGSFVRGALVTEEVVDTTDLAEMAKNHDPRLQNREYFSHISGQIAAIARNLHDNGFAHNDLKWRNLLVDGGNRPTVYMIDCPSGGYWWGVFLKYRIVKDLACLDKVAKHHLSRTQRLRFYLEYVRQKHLNAQDKKRIRNVLVFFEGRE